MLTNIWTTLLTCLFALFLGAWFVVFCHKQGIYPFRDFVQFLKRQSVPARFLWVLLFTVTWVVASSKQTGGTDSGGTNTTQMTGSPLSAPRMTSGLNASFSPVTSTNTTRQLTAADFDRGFVLTQVGTNEWFDFSVPSQATVCADWRNFGAANDWFYHASTNWSFRIGTNDMGRMRIFSRGRVEPFVRLADGGVATNVWFAPLEGDLGIVPEAHWGRLTNAVQSCFWYCLSPSNTLQLTWYNALLNRATEMPVSFQAEFGQSGSFLFRYDFSRLETATVSNILAGASLNGERWATNSLPVNVTSLAFHPLSSEDATNADPDEDGIPTIDELFVYRTDPHAADTDLDGLSDYDEIFVHHTDPLNPHSVSETLCDGFAVKIGDLDPLSFPEGSTNTVLEHVFYSGTTNGTITYPQFTATSAVLSVTVTGSGFGDLIVGEVAVPLLGGDTSSQTSNTACTTGTTLQIPVKKYANIRLRRRGGESLTVTLDSCDFAFGVLPSCQADGFVHFPNTIASSPCIHDFNVRNRQVSLQVDEESTGLSCAWHTVVSGVEIENLPPRSATITANFPHREERAVGYSLSHPGYLFGQTNFPQMVRFCPRQSDSEPETGDDAWGDTGEGVPSYGDSVPNEYWCCFWGKCADDDGTCACGCTNCVCTTDGVIDDEEVEDFLERCPDHLVPYEQCASLHETDYTNALQQADEVVGVLKIRDPLTYERIDLSCPDGPHHCCECPEHQSNYVAIARRSYRLKVVDGQGNDFRQSSESCSVYLAGVRPSSAIGDAVLAFVTNGATCRVARHTVLGVGFAKTYGAGLSTYNRLGRVMGIPMTVTTNIVQSLQLDLLTNVQLPFGEIRFAIDDAEGQFAVWMYDGISDCYRKLLDTNGRSEIVLSIARWRKILGRGSHSSSAVTPIYITSAYKGNMTLNIQYRGVSDGQWLEDSAAQIVTSVDPPLLPDYNRDGKIGSADIASWMEGRRCHFWCNEDMWRGDDAFSGFENGVHVLPFDLPLNDVDVIVNGRNDLVNLLPLAIDLGPFVQTWGLSAVDYEFVTGAPGNIRFTLTGTSWANAGDIVRVDQRTLFAEPLHEAELRSTERADSGSEIGYALPSRLLSMSDQLAGFVLLEFADVGNYSPAICIRDRQSGAELFRIAVPIRIHDVHQMYRWINLGHVCGGTTDQRYSTRTTVSWPDNEHADAQVVFVHGYNMHPDEVWNWSQAMFKRLWWSGMDAGFTAVLWRGNQSQFWIPGKNAYATKNYHQNVLNAFRTANALATEVAGLPGAKKFFIAHSLGNMLVSAARQDHGLRYEKYFMLNAAVAVEAYDAAGVTQKSKYDMTPAEWRDYPDRVRASHWYELFLGDADDARGALTWKNRFKDVDKTVNFYSTQDEVVANGDDSVDELLSRKFAWYNQEMQKGFRLVDFIPEAGWDFDRHYLTPYVSGYSATGVPVYSYRPYNATEAEGINPEALKTTPLFRDFTESDIYGANGSAYLLANNVFRWRTMSHGIPAESFAAGANAVPKWGADSLSSEEIARPGEDVGRDRNVDMATVFGDHRNNWVHSYFIQAPLYDTHQLFDRIVEELK